MKKICRIISKNYLLEPPIDVTAFLLKLVVFKKMDTQIQICGIKLCLPLLFLFTDTLEAFGDFFKKATKVYEISI